MQGLLLAITITCFVGSGSAGLTDFSAPDIIQYGTCAQPKDPMMLDLGQFGGVWYQVEMIPNSYMDAKKCIVLNFKWKGDSYNVTTYGLDEYNELTRQDAVFRKIQPEDNTLRPYLQIRAPMVPPVPYYVLKTDYTRYACVYSCYEFFSIMFEAFSVLSREAEVDETSLECCRAAFGKLNLDTTMLQSVEQGELCTGSWHEAESQTHHDTENEQENELLAGALTGDEREEDEHQNPEADTETLARVEGVETANEMKGRKDGGMVEQVQQVEDYRVVQNSSERQETPETGLEGMGVTGIDGINRNMENSWKQHEGKQETDHNRQEGSRRQIYGNSNQEGEEREEQRDGKQRLRKTRLRNGCHGKPNDALEENHELGTQASSMPFRSHPEGDAEEVFRRTTKPTVSNAKVSQRRFKKIHKKNMLKEKDQLEDQLLTATSDLQLYLDELQVESLYNKVERDGRRTECEPSNVLLSQPLSQASYTTPLPVCVLLASLATFMPQVISTS